MSCCLRRTILFVRRSSVRDLTETGDVCSLRWFSLSVASESKNDQQSLMIAYLMNSLGFTRKTAISTSRLIKFGAPEKPDKVVKFLRNFGFELDQINRLVRSFPNVLYTDPDKIILPKLEFFMSKGILRLDLIDRLSVYPTVLQRSLCNAIIPSYEYIKTYLGSDERTAEAIKQRPDILSCSVDKSFGANIATLREHGVPVPKIVLLIKWGPRVLRRCPVQFREGVKEAMRMGFDPSNSKFYVAVSAILMGTRENKVDLYKKLGWSDGEILEAFLRNPWFMTISEEKIMAIMDFMTVEMGFKPCDVAKFPGVFSHDLRKRVIPRLLFYRALLLTGLVKKQCSS